MLRKQLAGITGAMGIALLAGCASGGLEENSPYDQIQGNYAGVLPCADCSGIDTKLMVENQNDVSGTTATTTIPVKKLPATRMAFATHY